MKKITSVALILGTLYHIVGALVFVLENRFADPAYADVMKIDSESYIRAGIKLAASSTPWFTEDLWHGTGMQLVAGLLFRLTGAQHAGIIKIFNWLCFVLLICGWAAFTYRITRYRVTALLVAFLIACSNPLQKFCATAQYELSLTLLFCAILHLLLSEKPRAAWLAGVGITALGVFRLHFALTIVFLVPILYFFPEPHNRQKLGRVLGGFLLSAFIWNTAYSVRANELILFQWGIQRQVDGALNPTINGDVNLNAEQAEPRGVAFITKQPVSYLRLLGRRLSYLTGWHPHFWSVESNWSRWLAVLTGWDSQTARRVFLAASLILLLYGVTEARSTAGGLPISASLMSFTLLGAILVAQCLFNASNRFLVPVIPTFIYFQALAFRAVGVRLCELGTGSGGQDRLRRRLLRGLMANRQNSSSVTN